jgi:hypothetical protein
LQGLFLWGRDKSNGQNPKVICGRTSFRITICCQKYKIREIKMERIWTMEGEIIKSEEITVDDVFNSLPNHAIVRASDSDFEILPWLKDAKQKIGKGIKNAYSVKFIKINHETLLREKEFAEELNSKISSFCKYLHDNNIELKDVIGALNCIFVTEKKMSLKEIDALCLIDESRWCVPDSRSGAVSYKFILDNIEKIKPHYHHYYS